MQKTSKLPQSPTQTQIHTVQFNFVPFPLALNQCEYKDPDRTHTSGGFLFDVCILLFAHHTSAIRHSLEQMFSRS